MTMVPPLKFILKPYIFVLKLISLANFMFENYIFTFDFFYWYLFLSYSWPKSGWSSCQKPLGVVRCPTWRAPTSDYDMKITSSTSLSGAVIIITTNFEDGAGSFISGLIASWIWWNYNLNRQCWWWWKLWRWCRHSGTLAHWHTGTPAHWHIGTLAHRHTGTLAHWHTGTLAHWNGHTPGWVLSWSAC